MVRQVLLDLQTYRFEVESFPLKVEHLNSDLNTGVSVKHMTTAQCSGFVIRYLPISKLQIQLARAVSQRQLYSSSKSIYLPQDVIKSKVPHPCFFAFFPFFKWTFKVVLSYKTGSPLGHVNGHIYTKIKLSTICPAVQYTYEQVKVTLLHKVG